MRRALLGLLVCAPLTVAACGGRASIPADSGREASLDSAPDTTQGCSTSAECAATDYCQIDEGCGVTGGKLGQCRERPKECAAYYSPVCGCDGHDYSNPCEAHRRGVNIAYTAECPG